MRIAIVHDWLVGYTGAEKVLEQMLKVFPDADLFAVADFLPESQKRFMLGKKPTTSFIQRLPLAHRFYRYYLPFMPIAIEQFNLSEYDLVISSSHSVSKGVITGPNQLHISYCHSPARYAWDMQAQYLSETGLSGGIRGCVARWLLFQMRSWDYRSSARVDKFIANSQFVARRIWKYYRREATVIYPPVDVGAFAMATGKEDYYVTVSRLVPYKRIDVIAEAFSEMPGRQLVIIGEGPEYDKVRKKSGLNVTLLGFQEFEIVRQYVQRARAFVFAAEEDFGIAPLEAQACGTPVIGFAKGALRETVRGLDSERPTGVLFEHQTTQSIKEAVHVFEMHQHRIKHEACRENALRFSVDRFVRELQEFVDAEWKSFVVRRG